jgi:RimJ/RimL family protein N-acetyltransferase
VIGDALARAQALAIPDVIDTPRLKLAAPRASDVHATFEAIAESREELATWMPWAYPEPTLEGTQQYFSTVDENWRNRSQIDFQWIEKASGKLVGKGGFHHPDWTVPCLEIGYWLRVSEKGKGYCTEATNALVAYGREHLGAKRLEIRSDSNNERSRKVAERCGFVLEGVLRNNARTPAGALRDTCVYAKIFAEDTR